MVWNNGITQNVLPPNLPHLQNLYSANAVYNMGYTGQQSA